MRRSLVAAAAAFLLLFGLHFAEGLEARSGPPSKVWSRSVDLGLSDRRADLAVAPAGPGEYVFWVKGGSVAFARLLSGGKLGETGRIAQTAGVTVVAASPSEQPLLFWLDGEGLGGVRLSPEGARVVERYRLGGQFLSLAVAGEYLVAARPQAVEVYRVGEGQPRLAGSWPVPGVDRLGAWTDAEGLRLVMGQRDGSGNLRLWLAALSGAGPAAPPLNLGRFILSRSSVTGLRIGADASHLYVLMLQETYGQRRKYTVLQAVLPPRLGLPGEPPLAAEPFFLPVTPPGLPGISAISDLVLVPSGAGNLDAAVVASFALRRSTGYQLVTARLTPQGLARPTLATRSRGAVSLPAWAVHDDLRMLVYQETAGFDRWIVRAAGAGPAFRELNRLRQGDVSSALPDTLLSIFSVFQALYYVTATVFPAMAVMVGLYVAALTWSEHHPLPVFAAGAAAYLLGKVYLLPRTFYEAGIRALLPAWLAPPLTGQAVSLLFFALGCWAVGESWRKGRLHSPFTGLLLLGGLDLPLTLFLYTPYLR